MPAQTPDYVKKELEKLEKKERINEKQRLETQEALDKINQSSILLKHEAVALRTLATGNIPKSARPAMAQQLAEVMGVDYDEASIMGLIAKYEKQDQRDGMSPHGDAHAEVSTLSKAKPEVVEVETDGEVVTTPKKRGRPALTPEQKAENAKRRAMAAAQSASTPKIEEEPVDELDDGDEDYFNSDYED